MSATAIALEVLLLRQLRGIGLRCVGPERGTRVSRNSGGWVLVAEELHTLGKGDTGRDDS